MKYKAVVKASEVYPRIKALLSDQDVSQDLIYLDTNVIQDHEKDIAELIRKGANIIVSRVLVEELSGLRKPGHLSL